MMEHTRRQFLKTTGAAVIGVCGGSLGCSALAKVIGSGRLEQPDEAVRGRRWALVIDMARCLAQGKCRVCIDACHQLHNVPTVPPERSPKEDVKWIWKETFEHTFPEQVGEFVAENVKRQPVLVLCNHCDHPACVRVCPTQATFKREDGIVMMDMHRCIGCRYCIVACPYGARSFNWREPRQYLEHINPAYPTRRKGVVEKCTLCAERLARGLQPKCVEVCPAGALTFGDLADETSEVSRLVRAGNLWRRKPMVGTRPQVYYKVT